MKIRYGIIVIFFFYFSTDVFSQTSWNWNNPIPQGNSLRGLMVKSDDFGIAVGDVGTELTRSTGIFQTPAFPVNTNLGGICFYKDTLWIDGDNGVIKRSLDGGITWSDQSWKTSANLHGSFDLNKTTLWIAGDSGIILYTTNSGTGWTKQTNAKKNNLRAIANGDPMPNVYAVGDGVILQGVNYGSSGYFAIANKHTFTFEAVAMQNPEAFIVGDSGYILHRDFVADSTISDTIMDKAANNFYDVAFANPFVLVVGANGTIKVSFDDGNSWSSPVSHATEKLYKVTMAPNFQTMGIAWAVGENGVFLRTADSGKTWARLDSGVRGTVLAGAASPNGDLYATSTIGKSYRLLKGKTKWTLDSLKAGGVPRLTDIAFYKNGFGLCATYDISALKTGDSGKTWSKVIVNANAVQILGVAVWGSTGLASASNGVVYRSLNKGGAWTAQTTNNTSALYDVDLSGNNAIAVGFNGAAIYSADGGITWKNTANTGTTSLLNKVRFSTATNAVAVSNTGIIIRTIDGGATWKTISSGVTTSLNDVAFHDDINGMITGDGGVILKTKDGGKTWTKDQSNASSDLKGAIIIDGETAYAVGSNTTVLSTTNSSLPVDLISFSGRRISSSNVLLNWTVANERDNFGYSIERAYGDTWQQVGFQNGMGTTLQSQKYSLTDITASNDLLHYRLRQIDLDGSEHVLGTVAISPHGSVMDNDIGLYPNPANSKAKISFSILSGQNIRITVINELGAEIKVVTNASYQSGSYLLTLDTKDLPSGSYQLLFSSPSQKIVKEFVVAR